MFTARNKETNKSINSYNNINKRGFTLNNIGINNYTINSKNKYRK